MGTGDDGEPEIDGAAVPLRPIPGVDAPIERPTALGDVEVAEDLEARDDGSDVVRRQWRGLLLEHPVDPVAHVDVVLEGLDVNVARTQRDGVADDVLDQLLGAVVADELQLPRGSELEHEAVTNGLRFAVEAHAERLLDLVAVELHRLDGPPQGGRQEAVEVVVVGPQHPDVDRP